MVIDHVGKFLFPDTMILRIIGRFSFPLFAFLIANGAHYTKNINKYISRMLAFALISQYPYFLAHSSDNSYSGTLNILFTFSLALVAISIIKKSKSTATSTVIAISAAVIAYFLKVDYGAYGILLTILFYILFTKPKIAALSFVALSVVNSVSPAISAGNLFISKIDLSPIISTLSLAFILSYNYKEGLKARYLFYAFYPLHFLVIYLVKIFM